MGEPAINVTLSLLWMLTTGLIIDRQPVTGAEKYRRIVIISTGASLYILFGLSASFDFIARDKSEKLRSEADLERQIAELHV
ncbi:MAG: hypothetical protein M4579_005216 [Chaenotheca gracillima]|nr:MAG: hypothetical protein M4579_005216 [Chaenotheca gracillima]